MNAAVLITLSALAAVSLAAQTNTTRWGPWQVVGAQAADVFHGGSIVLPANSQIFHLAPSTGVTLRLVSSPHFGADVGDMALIEVGDTAVALVREGDQAALKVVDGVAVPRLLPMRWTLADGGYLVRPVELTITQWPERVVLTADGQVETIPVVVRGPSLEVVISAGASEAWRIDQLDLTTEPAAVSMNTSLAGASLAQLASGSTDAPPDGGSAAVVGTGEADGDSARAGSKRGTQTEAKPRSAILEIYSPPSVRHGRGDAVRAALAKAQQA